MAKKKNRSENEIDLTTFAWINAGEVPEKGVPGCGGCHPGGGGLEFDRDGQRYDRRAAADPLLADSLDGDYHDSRWADTGVIEADCFICHLPGYDYKARLRQLSRQNFQWAVIDASGIGRVSGAVKDGNPPSVIYNKRLFNDDGQVVLDLSSAPPSENCVFCHGKADLLKRGFSWNDWQNHDVHNMHGLNCICCHPGGLDHNFSKGDENLSTVRDDLDNTMLSCRECHTKGYVGAPLPKHRKIRPNHIEKLSCETCHIPRLNRAAAQGLCVSSGKVITYPKGKAQHLGDLNGWNPDYQKSEDGRLEPVNRFAANLYTNQDLDGIHYPLFARELERAYRCVDNLIGTGERSAPRVSEPDQIWTMLKALEVTLKVDRRFRQIRPAYHFEDRRYYLDGGGQLASEPDHTWVEEERGFSISHNVAPTRMALGANGCGDCHDRNAQMFTSWIAASDGGLGGDKDHTVMAGLQIQSLEGYLNSLHEHNHLKWIVGPVLFVMIFLIALFSGQGVVVAWKSVQAKAVATRLRIPLHQIALGLLAFTGYLFFYNNLALLELIFQKMQIAVGVHMAAGMVLVAFEGLMRKQREVGDTAGSRLEGILVLTLFVSGILIAGREHFGFLIRYGLAAVHASCALFLLALRLAHRCRGGMVNGTRLPTSETSG